MPSGHDLGIPERTKTIHSLFRLHESRAIRLQPFAVLIQQLLREFLRPGHRRSPLGTHNEEWRATNLKFQS